MKIIDTHCDALYKLQKVKHQHTHLQFQDAKQLQTNLQRLKKGNIKIQFFAIYLDPKTPINKMWHAALEQIELFHSEVLANAEIKQIKSWQQIKHLKAGEIGAILSLEGAEPIGNDLTKLHTLYELGVLSIGLTWNLANLCADGVSEQRGAGLTQLGKEVVRLNNEHQVLTDVSHLSVKAFWDVMEHAHYPIASHSNARNICNHPRNLEDAQIKCLIKKNAPIHLVFYPDFIKYNKNSVTISHLIEHIDYICSLGGVKHLGFGSDFDGIDTFVENLKDASDYQLLINELLKYYSEDEVRGFASGNFLNYVKKQFKCKRTM